MRACTQLYEPTAFCNLFKRGQFYDSFRSTCVGDGDGQGFYPRHRQQKRERPHLYLRASGMWICLQMRI